MGQNMKRREFLTLISGAVTLAPLAAQAQQAIPLVGIINAGSAAAARIQHEAFRSGMRTLGYVEGVNIRYEERFADGFLDRLPMLAAEMVRLNPAVVVSAPVPTNLAMKNATSTIPIVMATGADPVGFGLVESLSRPGGNVTGLTNFAEELAAKQLDLMRALIPRLSRVAVLVNVTNPLHVPQWQETQAAASQASLSLVDYEYRVPDDLERAFEKFSSDQAETLLVPPDTTFFTYRERIAAMAIKARLPAIAFNRLWTMVGFLMAYGPSSEANYRRASYFVDRILKGAKPGDLPIERPTKIDLIINLKTARLLGQDIPPMLLARADEVIE
jgi:putative tryptophan/tyrosine transport system substrate-binding protein